MSNKNLTAGLTSLQLLILNEPDQRFVLWIIANDSKAFSSYFLVELGKQQQLLHPNAAPNLAKAMVIYQNLLKKGMIDVSNPLKTKVSWRGQFYRFHTHPYFQSYGVYAATAIGIVGLLATVGVLKFQCNTGRVSQVTTQEDTTKQEIVKPVSPSDSTNLHVVDGTSDSVSLNRNDQNDSDAKTKGDSTKDK